MSNLSSRKYGIEKLMRGLSLVLFALIPFASWGQTFSSGQAGFIVYVEGDVVLRYDEKKQIVPVPGQQHLGAGQRLRTAVGRSEIALAPGLVLHVGENTELEMVKPHLSELKLQLISGSVILNVLDITYMGGISFSWEETEVKFGKRGVYRLDALPGEPFLLKVFNGKASVSAKGSKHKVKKRWSLSWAKLSSGPIVRKFNHLQTDSLDEWQTERTELIRETERVAKKEAACTAPTIDLPAQIGTGGRRPGAQGDNTTSSAGCKAF